MPGWRTKSTPSRKSALTFFVEATNELERALREHVVLDFPNKDGVRLRDTLLSVERQTNGRIKDPRIHEPTKVPDVGLRAWRVFWDLSSSRGGTGYGPAAITYVELKARSELLDEVLEPWEVVAIRRMDSAYIDEVAKKMSEDA